MTWIEDLEPCTMFGGGACASKLKAVGWLESGHPFRTGDVPDIVTNHLKRLLQYPYQPVQYLGGQNCEFCSDEGAYGHRNLFVPAKGFLYVCPELILHYITAHHYKPPNEFCNAVLRCYSSNNWFYMRRFRRNGGKCLEEHYDRMFGPLSQPSFAESIGRLLDLLFKTL